MLDKDIKTPKPNQMETHPYTTGKDEMREQVLAYIYERYCYYRTFFGKESETALELKRIILDIREDQALEQEKINSTDTDE
jgi:hypothetical protein